MNNIEIGIRLLVNQIYITNSNVIRFDVILYDENGIKDYAYVTQEELKYTIYKFLKEYL